MTNTYLTTDKLKGLKAHLKQVIPSTTVKVLKELESRGLELDYIMNYREKNKQILWDYICNEISKLGNQMAEDFNRLTHQGHFHEAREIVTKYVEKNYKTEWEIITDFKPNALYFWLQDFCINNHVDGIILKDLILAESFDKYLEKYEVKNVDKDLLKQAEKMADDIDKIYNPKVRNEESYNIYLMAEREYFITGNRQKLFNILNKLR